MIIVNESWWENHQMMRENEFDLINRNHQIMIVKDDEMNDLICWKWKWIEKWNKNLIELIIVYFWFIFYCLIHFSFYFFQKQKDKGDE